MSQIQKIDTEFPEPEIIRTAVDIIRKNGIVIAPTETLYGILGRADNPETVSKIYQLKNRPLSLPCSIFINSKDEMEQYGQLTTNAAKLFDSFLPGPLTLVLKNQSKFESPIVNDNKIGFRYSSSPVIKAILDELKIPLTATSANLSGMTNIPTIPDMNSVFGEKINLYLDSGPLNALTSTVVECLEQKINILRVGAISEKDISNCLEG